VISEKRVEFVRSGALPEDTDASAYLVERAEETFRGVERPTVSFWSSAEQQWQRWP